MFIVDDRVIWSASDLANAARCEYAVLRTLDYKLHRAEPLDTVRDPLETHIAALGDAYEADLLEERRQSGSIIELPRAEQPLTASGLHNTATATIDAFVTKPDVLYQPAFFDGEFFGYADFVEHTPNGWLVADAKLARHAKPEALLQLAAYADQIDALARAGRIDLPLAPTVSLLLGSGQRADFPIAEIILVFEERRGARLRTLLDTHRSRGRAVVWGEPDIAACGRCPECALAAEIHNDLLLVAGMRMEQRRRLHEVGITDVAALAAVDPTDESIAHR